MLPGFNVGPGLFKSAATGQIQFVGYSSRFGSGSMSLTSLTGGLGGAAQIGDVVLVFAGDGTQSPGVDFSLAGYTELCDLFQNTGAPSDDPNGAVYIKRLTAADATVAAPTNAGALCIATVWRGVDPVTQLDATTTTGGSTGGGTPNAPAITTVTAYAMVLAFFFSNNGAQSITAPTGYTTITTDGLGNCLTVCYKEVAVPGVEDPGNWGSFSTGSNKGDVNATIALRPGL